MVGHNIKSIMRGVRGAGAGVQEIAAHHGPTPAFQTIILDRACLGSILKGSRHSGGGQKACFQSFQKCTIFAQQTGPLTKSFRGKFSTPFSLL